MATNGLHAAEVLKTVPVDQPDLFATAPAGPPRSQLDLRPFRVNGQTAGPKQGGGHA